MSFREKSAWAMGLLMLVTGAWYFSIAARLPADAPAVAQIGPMIPYVLAVVIGSIVVQIVLAAMSPREAGREADERERVALDRAGNWSGYVLAVGAVAGALHYVVLGNGNVMFLWVIGALIAAQVAEYGLQIWFFRRGA
ncbi:hypothetical protein FHS61_001383 [Altererythrobacter atlanticus]|uniref:Uncharacterized protein n=1 Tax=Croceibacterium atlanticum TaxID=1267766 RepID=A0A0F7KZ12_9SPHN|nr:hypothetical protein [Croceibacterium atlanticum]AKH44065.1 hypothetical protein WYH_03045 [Croceibacterium atlanticum]MBB5732374.1 hypothetical protein [Croceibacterium atlanticum]